jgi:hypothetical protein
MKEHYTFPGKYFMLGLLLAPSRLVAVSCGVTQDAAVNCFYREGVVPDSVVRHAAATSARVRFGLIFGGTCSSANFNLGFPRPTPAVETGWKPGFTGGVFWQLPLHSRLSLLQAYQVKQLSGRNKSENSTYRFTYLSLPVQLRYQLNRTFAMVAGVEPALLIEAQKRSGSQQYSITHEVEERNIGIIAGTEVMISRRISATAQYLQGINHVGIREQNTVREFKFQSLQVALQYYWR